MTEDDTFRILSRPTYDEMSSLRSDWIDSCAASTNKIRDHDKFLEEHGWTWPEFITQLRLRMSNGRR